MERKLECGRLPGRRRRALWVLDGSVIRPLAYFVSDEAFETFMSMSPMYRATEVPNEDEENSRD